MDSFSCEICMEIIPSRKKFISHSPTCDHPLCTGCVSEYIATKIGEGISTIKCPSSDCRLALDPISCRRSVSKRVFSKWCDFLFNSCLIGRKICICPYKSCSEAIINEGDCGLGKINCPMCKNLLCFECEVPWGLQHKCSQTENPSLKIFLELTRKKKWAKCPRCLNVVDRIDGCNFIKCRCGANFCYVCEKTECTSSHLAQQRRLDFWNFVLIYAVVLVIVFTGIIVHNMLMGRSPLSF